MSRAHLGITTCLLVLASGCVEGEQPYRHYDRYAEAVSAGELRRGWLPRWVPDAASDIHLQGDIDTSEVWLRFRLPAQGNQPLRDTLKELSPEEIGELPWRQPRGAKGWWPRNLLQQQPADDIALNADIFSAPRDSVPGRFIVAFERRTSDVFAWSDRAEQRHAADARKDARR